MTSILNPQSPIPSIDFCSAWPDLAKRILELPQGLLGQEWREERLALEMESRIGGFLFGELYLSVALACWRHADDPLHAAFARCFGALKDELIAFAIRAPKSTIFRALPSPDWAGRETRRRLRRGIG